MSIKLTSHPSPELSIKPTNLQLAHTPSSEIDAVIVLTAAVSPTVSNYYLGLLQLKCDTKITWEFLYLICSFIFCSPNYKIQNTKYMLF